MVDRVMESDVGRIVRSADKGVGGLRARLHRSSRKLSLAVALAGVALLVLGAGSTCFRVWAQQAGGWGIDASARGRSILDHLDSVIQYYRASTQSIQKAGEPNDVVYRDQAVAESTQIASFAFQSAKADAGLMARYVNPSGEASASGTGEQQRLQAAEDDVDKQIVDLGARDNALDKQIEKARPSEIPALHAQKAQIKEALDLAHAMKEALQKIVGMSTAEGGKGLPGDIDRLHHSVPEIDGKNVTPAPPLTMLDSARSAGVTSQGSVLFDLFETRRALDALLQQNAKLEKQATALRAPMSKILRDLLQQGQQLSQSQQGAAVSPSTSSAGGSLPAITNQFKALSAATVPLSQEIIVIEEARANLVAWKNSTNDEYRSVLHSLLSRVLVIVIALLLIIGGGEVWTRATNKYVHDMRRRRQFLIVRRFVVTFLSVMVVVFGFVTQFNSLATFAGFITAGIAVGLQTMLLSVAAYFFIIGRYGIKVGDRITIASVTGDVVDVGLVRFYLMELAGSGTSLNPTGRIAVFSNAVLFQAGTPLYKQIPGTDYAWHELIVKLNDGADYKTVCAAIVAAVQAVYEQYRQVIEAQHSNAESSMQTSIDSPGLESRLQFTAGAFQLWTRFPVEIERSSDTDDAVIHALLDLMSKDPSVKAAIAATPVIQASVKG
jgi:small-conductance mechanosensitive channel